jgi:outer membrane lipoprotein carrier protein
MRPTALMLVALTAAAASAAAEPAAQTATGGQALLQKIEAVYSKAETLRARFEVETVNQALGQTEIERGELFVSRPNRMKWQYLEPDGKVVLLDGKHQWMYLPEEGQAFRGEQTEATSELTLSLLADPGTLEKRFRVEPATAPDGAAEGQAFLRLEPHDPDPDLKSVLLGVDEASGQVRSMHVVDPFDNVTRVRLSELQFNPRISDRLWDLKLPKGTELLNMQGEPIRN